jgi:hypothetical protein
MSSIEEKTDPSRILNVISIFYIKRPDFCYKPGLNLIVALLCSVFVAESDAFVMFAHIMENLFPRVNEN